MVEIRPPEHGPGFVVHVDPAQQVPEVGAGELPGERQGGAVVAVHEGEQGMAEGAQASEVAGGEDLLLDDGKDWYRSKVTAALASKSGRALAPRGPDNTEVPTPPDHA